MRRLFPTSMCALSVLWASLCGVAQPANAESVSFDFSSVADASVMFTGTDNKIEFPNTGTYDFVINASTSPNLGGLHGNIGGVFTVGTISSPFPDMEQASVTATNGAFSIDDGDSNTLTASLDWKDIQIFYRLVGGLNVTGIANLSNVSYSGFNSALLDIKNGSDQSVVLTFQFSPLTKKSLTELMTDGQVNSTSYSGSLSSVPEPSSCVLLGMAALGLSAYSIGRRQRRDYITK